MPAFASLLLLPFLAATGVAAQGPVTGTAGAIRISSAAPGRVFLDGVDMEQDAPVTIGGLPVGTHVLEIRGDCVAGRIVVEVSAGQTARVQVPLESQTGSLAVTSVPMGAVVYVDDVEVGLSPYTGRGLACGEHRLLLQAPGYYASIRTVRVPASAEATLDIRMDAERFGAMAVQTQPPTASVAVDGVVLRTGSGLLERLAIGPHTLVFSAPGYAPETRQVVVAADGFQRESVVLKPLVETPRSPVATALPAEIRASRDATTPVAQPTPVLRLAADTLVATGGLTLGVLSWERYAELRPLWDYYVSDGGHWADENAAHAWHAANIQPSSRLLAMEASAAGVLLAGGVALWVTTPGLVHATPLGFELAW
jgi:hypothetical protein